MRTTSWFVSLSICALPLACGSSFTDESNSGKDASASSAGSAGREAGGAAPGGAASGGAGPTGGTTSSSGGRTGGGGVAVPPSSGGAAPAPDGGGDAEAPASGGAASGGAGGSSAGGSQAAAGGGGVGGSTTCVVVEKQEEDEGGAHVADCATVTYGTNPPSSGAHYGTWAAFKVYERAIPEGFWVHDLEHGAVVITYNCPDGCDDEVKAAEAMIDALPTDQLCLQEGNGVLRRIILVPDPHLTTRFAASAWGFTLRAPCFDAEAFRSFVESHYGKGPEDLCSDGADVSSGLPAGCGEG